MANVILGDKREEVKDGDNIKAACEELGVPFGCKEGVCGTCKIVIEEGEENLGPLTSKEEEMEDRDETHRLACQAKITSGTITIKIEDDDSDDDENDFKEKDLDEDYLTTEEFEE
ncbi:2Fe-2S iron-sulfur cluster binding domain-containing protein [Candidatus Woesearchaeota archaeon]|nr:2Fe-2S iron-sulfur cluster binding domain-containing protein [Candidatus Woesearchaeota archaeon]